MSLFPLLPATTSSTTTTPQGALDSGSAPTRQSSALQHPKRSDLLCYCVEEVDLDVFCGVFAQQWLRGRVFGPREPIYFCTSCGPPAVQEALKESDKSGGKKGGKNAGTPTAGKEKGKFSLSKLFGKSFTLSTKKETTATPVTAMTAYAGNGVGTPLTSSSAFGGGSFDNGLSLPGGDSAPLPLRQQNQQPFQQNQQPFQQHHRRGFSAEEEAAPVTPRTEEELFLCATCGACYCKNHAADHHYSRRRPDEANWCGGANATNADGGGNFLNGYPHHSLFLGVPSFISTHPTHVMEETPWGLLFPTVLLREVEMGALDLSCEHLYFDKVELLLDELMARDSNRALPSNAGGGKGSSGRNSFALPRNPSRGSTSNLDLSSSYKNNSNNNTISSGFGLTGTPGKQEIIAGVTSSTTKDPEGGLRMLTATDYKYESSGSGSTHVKNGGRRNGEPSQLPADGLTYTSQGSDRWSYMCWCARCGSRPVRLSAKHYDDGNSRQRRLRQLGESLAILSYLCRRGVKLELPAKFVEWKAADDAAARRRQQQQAQGFAAIEKRVGKATETVEFAVSTSAAARDGEDGNPNARTTASGEHWGDTDAIDLTRTETDRVLARACLSGFSNSSYFCYLNSVLQCVLRCVFFTRPIMALPINGYPGKLTKSLGMLLHHLEQQTYQDVRNGAIYPFVKSVYRQICRVSSLFELDEQQDAQELLITLLNGVADEFDKNKSAEEKSRMPRISFEGSLRSEVVCSRCHHRVPRDEMFMSLSIPIKHSIDEGLRDVFQPAFLKGKDRYACECCFKKLTPAQQQAHNEQAQLQAEERNRLRAEGKRVPPTSEDAAKQKSANCVYQEAEVRTSITRLGGTLAVHLLRFHYDAEQQNFVKVASPVEIALTIDLASYVSTEVLETYNTARSMRTLRSRFPAVAETTLQEYLRRAGGDQGVATKQLLTDGHGVEDNLESSINGDAQLPVPPPSAVEEAIPDSTNERGGSGRGRAQAAAVGNGAVKNIAAGAAARPGPPPFPPPPPPPTPPPGPAVRSPALLQGKRGATGSQAPILGATATGKRRGDVSEIPSPLTATAAAAAKRQSGATNIAGERSVFAAEDDDAADCHQPFNAFIVHQSSGNNKKSFDSEDDDESVASVVHSISDIAHSPDILYSATSNDHRGGGSCANGSGGCKTVPDSLNYLVDLTATAPGSQDAGATGFGAAGGAAGPLGVPGSSGGGAVASKNGLGGSGSTSTTLTAQQIQRLRRVDFDPLGDRSCPVVGGGAGEKRAIGGGKGLCRTASLTRQLVGIVTHRGSLHGGHYIAYVRHLGRPEVWFRCDDEDVDIVTEKTVLACAAEVYLAFYE